MKFQTSSLIQALLVVLALVLTPMGVAETREAVCTDTLSLAEHMQELSLIVDRVFVSLDRLKIEGEERVLADSLQVTRKHLLATIRMMPSRMKHEREDLARVSFIEYQRQTLRAIEVTLEMELLILKPVTTEPGLYRKREKIAQLALDLQKIISAGHCRYRGC